MAANQPGPKTEYAGSKEIVTLYLPKAVADWLKSLGQPDHSAAHVGRDKLVALFERETGTLVERLTDQ